MVIDEKVLRDCADWIAEQLSEEMGGFIASELVDLIMLKEIEIRGELGDEAIDHRSMTGYLMPRLEAEGVPIKLGAVTPQLVEEILHWEDEALAMAGFPRNVRR